MPQALSEPEVFLLSSTRRSESLPIQRQVWPAIYIFLPGQDLQVMRPSSPERLNDGSGELEVGDERNACVHGGATDKNAVRASERVIFARHIYDEIDLALINQLNRAETIPSPLLDGGAGDANHTKHIRCAVCRVDGQPKFLG